MEEANMELATVIASLRGELQKAVEEGQGKDLRFTLQEIEVEFKCSVKSETGGGVGVKFWVVNANMKGSDTNELVHTVKLKMQPLDQQGGHIQLNDTVKEVR